MKNTKHFLLILLTPLLFIPIFLFSQIGPGGLGNNSDNGLWLRAGDIAAASGSAVASWGDASENANAAAQTTAAKQPLYFTTSALNGQPVVRFDGTDDEMAVPDADILDGTQGITYFAVVRPNNINGAPRGVLGKRITYTTPDHYAYTWFFHSGNTLVNDIHTQNDRYNSGANTFSNATNYMLDFRFDGSQPAAQRSMMHSGSTEIAVATEASTALPNSNQDLALGALNVGYGTYLGADYAEVIHYNYALSDLDFIIVRNYLSAKYDIALSVNDLYDEDDAANGNYDHEVAGIGRISASDLHDDSQGSAILRINNPTDLSDGEYMFWGHDNGTLPLGNTTDIPGSIDARSDRVWRVSEVSSGGASVDVGTVDMRWDMSGLGSYDAADLRLLVDSNNDGFFANETPISGATALGGDVFEFAGVTSISDNLRFTIGFINSSALPVELTYFNAFSTDNKYVKLKWQTASEINNDYFTVERSVGGLRWKGIDKINGTGTSNNPTNYNAIDESALDGLSFYRLKQTDFDGNYEYSNIRSVNIEKADNGHINIYPNPTSKEIYLDGNNIELETIKIYDMLGKDLTPLVRIYVQNESFVKVNLVGLPSGKYFVRTGGGVYQVFKK